MIRTHTVLAALLAASLAVACGGKSAAPAVDAKKPGSSAERALCLAPVDGSAGAVDRTIGESERAIAANPSKSDLWIVLGRAWVEKARNTGDPGFYLHADACAQEVLKTEPDNKLAIDLRGLSLMNDHKFAEAKALEEKVLAKNPEDLMAWGTLSDAQLELGDVDGAEQSLAKMMQLKPSLPSYSRTSYLRWLRGDVAGALEAGRLAIDAGKGQKDHEPEAWVLTDAANIFWMRGDVDGSLKGYEMALAEKPDHPAALVGKARCLIAQGKATEAMPLLQRAFDRSHLVETAWWLSKAHEVAGDASGAREWLRRAIDAGKEGDRRSLALVLATVNQDIGAATKAIDDDNAHRGGVYADDVAALVAYRAGDLNAAQEKSARALSLGTPDPRLWLHRGVILAASAHGDDRVRAEAKKLVDDAMKAGLRFDPSAVALANEVGLGGAT